MPYSDYDDEGNLIPRVAKTINIPGPVDSGSVPIIPQPGPIAGQLGQLAQHPPLISDPQYQHHGWQRFGDIMGGIAGGVGGHPEIGRQLANTPYRRAMTDWQTKIDALGAPLKDEESRTNLGLNVAKLGEKTDLDKQKEDRLKTTSDENVVIKQQLADERTKSDEYTRKWHDGEISLKELHEHFDEQDKLVKQLQKQLEDKDKNSNLDKTLSNRTHNAEIIAGGKNATPNEQGSIEGYANTFKQKHPDPKQVTSNDESYRAFVESLPTKIQAGVVSSLTKEGYPAPIGAKVSTAEVNTSKNARNTLGILNRTRQHLESVRGRTGPISGRIIQGKLVLGSNDKEIKDLQALSTDLSLLPISEATALGSGRATGVLVDQLKNASGRFSMPYNQLKAALDEIEPFVKSRLSPDDAIQSERDTPKPKKLIPMGGK